MSSYRDDRVFFYLCLCVLIDSCILQPARASLLCPYQFLMLCEHGACRFVLHCLKICQRPWVRVQDSLCNLRCLRSWQGRFDVISLLRLGRLIGSCRGGKRLVLLPLLGWRWSCRSWTAFETLTHQLAVKSPCSELQVKTWIFRSCLGRRISAP